MQTVETCQASAERGASLAVREWEGATLQRIEADFAIATPLFLGDAERSASRLALASLKGALRFWWRAWAYAAPFAEAKKDRAKALSMLHGCEQDLFGASGGEGESASGQSRVLLRLAAVELGSPFLVNHRLADGHNQLVGPGARYLGYGLMGAFGSRGGMLDRSCYPAGGRFQVELLLRGDLEPTKCDGVLAALKLLGLLGGFGARSRRGWGSLSLERLSGDGVADWWAPAGVEQYAEAVRQVVPENRNSPDTLPPFTAFSSQSRIEVVRVGDDGLRVLDTVGQAMQRYRAWGFKGRVNNQPSEQNFKLDHDWSKTPWGPEFRGYVPQRAAFGLPHNYGKGTRVAPAEGGDRRASPLFIHVHKFGTDRYAAVLALLPAQFVPEDRVALTWPQQRAPVIGAMPKDWLKVLHGFFDGPPPDPQRRRLGSYFPERTPVLRP